MCLYCRTSQSLYYALYIYVVTFQERIESTVSFFTGYLLGLMFHRIHLGKYMAKQLGSGPGWGPGDSEWSEEWGGF